MVIESVQRDGEYYCLMFSLIPSPPALTGEPIFNDNDMWQAARDENRTKVQHYTTLLDTMMNTLTNTSNQLEVYTCSTVTITITLPPSLPPSLPLLGARALH